MKEFDLVDSFRDLAVDAVTGRTKPVTVQIGVYAESGEVTLSNNIKVSAILPSSVGEVKAGDNVLVLKQNGTNVFFIIAKL